MKNFVLFIAFLITGCDGAATKNEFSNKSEYSLLQSFELKYRETDNKDGFILTRNALSSNMTVLAFPIKGQGNGYVVMLAEAEGVPKEKTLPDVEFVVTNEELVRVKAEIRLSPEVEKLIMSKIKK